MKRIREQSAPQARTGEIVVEEMANEVLVYDLKRDRAHCLNATAASVWKLCDGKTSPARMASELHGNLDPAAAEEVVWSALDQLGRAGLLENRLKRPGGLSRRDVLKRIAVAAAVTVPVVTSVVAPKATHAATCRPSNAACTTSTQCCSGVCSAGRCA